VALLGIGRGRQSARPSTIPSSLGMTLRVAWDDENSIWRGKNRVQ